MRSKCRDQFTFNSLKIHNYAGTTVHFLTMKKQKFLVLISNKSYNINEYSIIHKTKHVKCL